MDIGALLRFGAAPAAEALTARNLGQASERDRLHQQALQLLAQQRQDRQDQIAEDLKRAQARSANALADQRSAPKSDFAGFKIAPDGSLIALYKDGSYTDASPRDLLAGSRGQPSPTGTSSVQVTQHQVSAPPIEQNVVPVKPNGLTGDIDLAAPDVPRGTITPPPQQGGPTQKPPRNFAKPVQPKAPPLADKLQQRVSELVAQGMQLAKANEKARLEYGQLPNQQSFVFPTVTGPNGEQVVARANTKTGEIAPTDVAAKAGGTEGERAGMAAAFLSRLKMGKADFDNGMNFIRNYHEQLSKNNTITPAMMAASAAANVQPNPEAHGLTGILNNAGGSVVAGMSNKALAKTDPTYQRYINLLNSMSLAMTEVLPRPTQQILGIEKGINTVKAGDPPERIADIQHRLDKAYEYLFSDPEGMLRKGPATGAPPKAAKPSGVAAKYGITVTRPEDE